MEIQVDIAVVEENEVALEQRTEMLQLQIACFSDQVTAEEVEEDFNRPPVARVLVCHRRSRIHDNLASGLSADDSGTLRALGVATYDNDNCGIQVGEGSNGVQIGAYLWASQRTNENWPDAKIFQLELLEDHHHVVYLPVVLRNH